MVAAVPGEDWARRGLESSLTQVNWCRRDRESPVSGQDLDTKGAQRPDATSVSVSGCRAMDEGDKGRKRDINT